MIRQVAQDVQAHNKLWAELLRNIASNLNLFNSQVNKLYMKFVSMRNALI